MLTKLILFLPFLFLTFSVSGINGPIRGNWLNPMAGGAPLDIESPVHIFLDNENGLTVNLIVTTTDNRMDLYDPLLVYYSFGHRKSGFTERVTQDDLVEIEPGIYEAVFQKKFNYYNECESSPDGLLPTNIIISLTSTNLDEFVDYPFEQNTGLFNPHLYDDLKGVNTNKGLICWDINNTTSGKPSNEDDTKKDFEDGMTFNQSLEIRPQGNIKIEKEIHSTSVQPNPFANEFSLRYVLDKSSDVQIQVLDMKGKQIALRNKVMQVAGSHYTSFTLEDDLPPGLYTVVIRSSEKTEAIKLIKMKNLN